MCADLPSGSPFEDLRKFRVPLSNPQAEKYPRKPSIFPDSPDSGPLTPCRCHLVITKTVLYSHRSRKFLDVPATLNGQTMNTPPPSPATVPPGRSPLVIVGILFLLIIVAAATALWWWTRPIHATVLTAPSKQALEQKLEAAEAGTTGAPAEAPYEPGAKVIVLTEREVNGLLEMNGLGDEVRIDFATDAIHARVRTDLDPVPPA